MLHSYWKQNIGCIVCGLIVVVFLCVGFWCSYSNRLYQRPASPSYCGELKLHNQMIHVCYTCMYVYHHLMLPLVIWAPLESYPITVSPKYDGTTLKGIDWCGVHWKPRLIHDVNSCCLLISRVYKCQNRHEILGHHPDILSHFNAAGCRSVIPFRLYHQTET